jgi:hypothetical protein
MGRPRRWWLALVLNGLFAPTGYAYVGAWRTLAVFCALVGVGAFALPEAIHRWPAAADAFGKTGLLVGALVLALALGAHAAWLATRAPPRTGASRAIVYIVPWILLTMFNMVVRTYGPHPVSATVPASVGQGLSH